MGTQGIDELEKVIDIIKEGGVGLAKVDWTKAREQAKDVDSGEAMRLLADIGEAAVEIFAALAGSAISGPIFSLLLKKKI